MRPVTRLVAAMLLWMMISTILCEDCSAHTRCVEEARSQAEKCKDNLDCHCQAMILQVACYRPCMDNEKVMESKANHVEAMKAQCSGFIRHGPSAPVKDARYKLITNIATSPMDDPSYVDISISGRREVFYDPLKFELAGDPEESYVTVMVYQSMPDPGTYSSFGYSYNYSFAFKISPNPLLLLLASFLSAILTHLYI